MKGPRYLAWTGLTCLALLKLLSQYHLPSPWCLVFSVRGSGECVSCAVSPLQKHTHTHAVIAEVNAERGRRGKQSSSERRLASSELRKWRSCRTDASPRRCCKRVEILLALQPAFLSTLLHFILQWGKVCFTVFSHWMAASFFVERVYTESPEAGRPGTGVDKLSSRCCLVSRELS